MRAFFQPYRQGAPGRARLAYGAPGVRVMDGGFETKTRLQGPCRLLHGAKLRVSRNIQAGFGNALAGPWERGSIITAGAVRARAVSVKAFPVFPPP